MEPQTNPPALPLENFPATKEKYSKPKLKRYGSVKTLTRGGSGHAQESSQGNKPRP